MRPTRVFPIILAAGDSSHLGYPKPLALFNGRTALDLAVENCRLVRLEEPLFFSAMAYYSLGDKEKTKARLQELVTTYPQSQYVKKAKGLMGLME